MGYPKDSKWQKFGRERSWHGKNVRLKDDVFLELVVHGDVSKENRSFDFTASRSGLG
jgi:hypothetical protein